MSERIFHDQPSCGPATSTDSSMPPTDCCTSALHMTSHPSCDGPAACADRAWTEIERLREQVQYRDDVIAMLRREVSVLRDELRLAGEEARRD